MKRINVKNVVLFLKLIMRAADMRDRTIQEIEEMETARDLHQDQIEAASEAAIAVRGDGHCPIHNPYMPQTEEEAQEFDNERIVNGAPSCTCGKSQ
jgi:hypothetical protein